MSTGTIRVLAKHHMMSKSRNEKVSVIDLNKVKKIHMLPRIDTNLFLMTPMGKTANIEQLATFFIEISLLLLTFYAIRWKN